jgi:hypothetical protein
MRMMTMNEVERYADNYENREWMPLCEFARKHNWLMPCFAFAETSFDDQIQKIREEVEEVIKAHQEYTSSESEEARKNLLMECADVQMCVETLMYQLGTRHGERTRARRLVWEKNNDRDYFKKRKE